MTQSGVNLVEPTSGGRSRGRRAAIAFAVVALVVVVLAIFNGYQPDAAGKLVYQGRPLRLLLADLLRPASSSNYVFAASAVRELGDDCLPALEQVIAERTPWHSRLFVHFQGRMPARVRKWTFDRLQPYRHENEWRGALHAVGLLGTNAAPIAPGLTRRFGQSDYADKSALAQVMPKVGAAMVPEMKRFLTDSDLQTRGLAAFVMHQLGPASAGVFDDLIAGLAGADANHRSLVAQTLGRMGSAAMPSVTNLFGAADPLTRSVGLRAFDSLLPRAMEITPMIAGLLDDPDREVRVRAALLIANWWALPASDWRAKLEELPPDHPTRLRLDAAVAVVAKAEPRVWEVLHEGFGAEPQMSLQVARTLVNRQQVDAELISALEELLVRGQTARMDMAQVETLLASARKILENEAVTGTGSHPRTVEGGQSLPSGDPPPPDKSP